MSWIKKLFKDKKDEDSGAINLACSACMKVTPLGEAHVIPWWNDDRNDFLTTYRCSACFPQSIGETRSKIRLLDADTREKFCEFLERHQYIEDAQVIRNASLEEASRMIGSVLDAIESGDARLSP